MKLLRVSTICYFVVSCGVWYRQNSLLFNSHLLGSITKMKPKKQKQKKKKAFHIHILSRLQIHVALENNRHRFLLSFAVVKSKRSRRHD